MSWWKSWIRLSARWERRSQNSFHMKTPSPLAGEGRGEGK
jgi:hypothetical protein